MKAERGVVGLKACESGEEGRGGQRRKTNQMKYEKEPVIYMLIFIKE